MVKYIPIKDFQRNCGPNHSGYLMITSTTFASRYDNNIYAIIMPIPYFGLGVYIGNQSFTVTVT